MWRTGLASWASFSPSPSPSPSSLRTVLTLTACAGTAALCFILAERHWRRTGKEGQGREKCLQGNEVAADSKDKSLLPGLHVASPQPPNKVSKVLILFCSQTGMTRDLASRVKTVLTEKVPSLEIQVKDLETYEPEDLFSLPGGAQKDSNAESLPPSSSPSSLHLPGAAPSSSPALPRGRPQWGHSALLLLASTWELGLPPPSSSFFFHWLRDAAQDFRVGAGALGGVPVACLGVGSRAYGEELFCAPARLARGGLLALGAEELCPLVLCDVDADLEEHGVEGQFGRWVEGLVRALSGRDEFAHRSQGEGARRGGQGVMAGGHQESSAKGEGGDDDEDEGEYEEEEEEEEGVVESSVLDLEDILGAEKKTLGREEVSMSTQVDVTDFGSHSRVSLRKRAPDKSSKKGAAKQGKGRTRNPRSGAERRSQGKTKGALTLSTKPGTGVPSSSGDAPPVPPDMVNSTVRASLEKQGYRVLGSHSGVKMCRWTKSQLRGRGGCYKHSFYGIQSHQCMETTPSLACANKCVFCWRHHTNPVGKSWRWKVDPPLAILESALSSHAQMVRQMRGVPGVKEERLAEAVHPRHCALSLVGEPIMYPHINEFLDMLHEREISSFLVTNGQFPEQIENLRPVTQLYVSVDAATKQSLKSIDRPLFPDFWERLVASLASLRARCQRTVYRLTLVSGWNTEEIENYAGLVRLGQPDFIEIKGVTYCGSSKGSSLTMKNVPYHKDVKEFGEALCAAIARQARGEGGKGMGPAETFHQNSTTATQTHRVEIGSSALSKDSGAAGAENGCCGRNNEKRNGDCCNSGESGTGNSVDSHSANRDKGACCSDREGTEAGEASACSCVAGNGRNERLTEGTEVEGTPSLPATGSELQGEEGEHVQNGGVQDAEGGPVLYELACEHEHSCCILLARPDKFKPGGVWHTWIDYDRFQELVKGGGPFSSQDYLAPTPPWAVYGAQEAGFDPGESRVRKTRRHPGLQNQGGKE